MAVDAVIFDWGGTLSEFVSIELVDVWRLAARHIDPDREDEIAEVLFGVEDRFWQRTSSTQTSGTLAQLVAEASAELGLDVAEAVLEEAAVRHLDAWTPHIRHQPDAAATLEALRDRGLRIGLLSNTHWPRTFHEELLAKDGLAELIDVRLYTSEMSHMKPHPSVFQAALDAVGVADPQRAVFVGDRPYDDVHGAKQAGLRGVLVANGHAPAFDVEPDAVVGRLGDLVDVVDGWRS